jgi:hypothetical protein
MNRIRTSSLKKLLNQTRIELTKKSNRTNRTQTKIESDTEHIMNYELFLRPYKWCTMKLICSTVGFAGLYIYLLIEHKKIFMLIY